MKNSKEDRMKRIIALALAVPAVAFAAGPFDGTWRTKLDTIKLTGKPDSFEIRDGVYSCNSCVPPYKLKADGSSQPVPDHDYVDHTTVNIVDAKTVKFSDMKGGKPMGTSTFSVSPNGSVLTVDYTSNVGAKPTSGRYTEHRVAPPAAGAHAISGSWMLDQQTAASDEDITVILEATGGGMKVTYNGMVTDAKFDGKEVAVSNDPGHSMASLKKVSERQFEVFYKHRGKVFDDILYTLSADGKSMNVADTDPQHETKTTWTMEKLR
jgi:hypothetical protein